MTIIFCLCVACSYFASAVDDEAQSVEQQAQEDIAETENDIEQGKHHPHKTKRRHKKKGKHHPHDKERKLHNQEGKHHPHDKERKLHNQEGKHHPHDKERKLHNQEGKHHPHDKERKLHNQEGKHHPHDKERKLHNQEGKHHTIKGDSVDINQNNYFLLGLRFFHQGNLRRARFYFEKLNTRDKDFISALLELQKINYTEKKWGRFFAIATYYRQSLLSVQDLSVQNFRQEILLLEILGLFRYCRYQDAKKVYDWGMSVAHMIKKDVSLFTLVDSFFQLGQLSVQLNTKQSRFNWSQKKILWPIQPNQIISVDNPKHLRMKLRSQC